MSRGNSRQMRTHPKLKKELELASTNRVRMGVDKKTRTLPEMTRMMTNAPSFKKLMRELSTIPRKEDLK